MQGGVDDGLAPPVVGEDYFIDELAASIVAHQLEFLGVAGVVGHAVMLSL
ncbi:MAG TPA: hypothetical protein VMU34_10095 [Mycobacterium sp.]|nr:hypothetical protein [Mycobacterium sp.]